MSTGVTRVWQVVFWEIIRHFPLQCKLSWHSFSVILSLSYNSYQYDVDPVTQSFANRRVFAYTDSGVPDGIELDMNNNIYSGCGDGVNVWDSTGTLIGKFFLNSTTAQMVFTKSGLLILNEERIYLANIQAQGIDLIVY